MPRPTRELVLTKVREIFPSPLYDEAVTTLDMYQDELSPWGLERVQLAVLKLSGGKIDRLRDLMDAAVGDPRDVIAPAEYPNFYRIGFVGVEKLDSKGVRKLKEDDLSQLLAWLLSTEDPDLSKYEDWLSGRDESGPAAPWY